MTISSIRAIRRLFSQALQRPSDKIKVTINNIDVYVEEGIPLIQACEQAGIEIPRFCYHQRLAIAGNCRMCLVQVEKIPKPVASCAMPVSANMQVYTDTPMVKKAREGVMEFLLANHPLDCPICDQGGECDLQDQAMAYGADKGRFREVKRAVEDKNFGPLVKTSMNRCIHCTRCVRFMNEVAGWDDLGTSGRGNDMQISTYFERKIDSELSGNIIDLCPVGALTSKPHAFSFRPWELSRTNSIDVMDAMGSAIRVDSLGIQVKRILPRENEEINQEWLSDKSRFASDALSMQRLLMPFIRESKQSQLMEVNWELALKKAAEIMNSCEPEAIYAISGKFTDVETLVAAKDLLTNFGSNNCIIDRFLWHGKNPFQLQRGQYLFNSKFSGVECTEAILLIGANPKWEAPLLNARIRKRWLNSNCQIFSLGVPSETLSRLGYECQNLGLQLTKKTLDVFVEKAKSCKNPMVIIGGNVLGNESGEQIISLVESKLSKSLPMFQTENWNGFNMLHNDASICGAFDVGYSMLHTKSAFPKAKIALLLGADDFEPIEKALFNQDTLYIYIGHHGEKGAERANVILPGQAYTEKSTIFLNNEGRPQKTLTAVPGPGKSREDWAILRALAEYSGRQEISYSSKTALYQRIHQSFPHLTTNLGEIIQSQPKNNCPNHEFEEENFSYSFHLPIQNYYQTDVISRTSRVMAQCSREFSQVQ